MNIPSHDFVSQIASAEIPPDLKAALTSYFEVFEATKSSLPAVWQHIFPYWLKQIVQQATDPAVETHWWEIALNLIAKELAPLGEVGQPLIAAGTQLAPHLAAHLGPYTDVRLREKVR